MRLDIGDEEKNAVKDVFSIVAVCRMKTQYGMPPSTGNRLTNPITKHLAITQEQSATSDKKSKKTPTRGQSDLEGYERVSMFPYAWYLALAYPIIVVIAGYLVYMLSSAVEERTRILLTFAALFVTALSTLYVQHNILTFRCRRCGCKMTKYRDADTGFIAYYYVCDKCRIYWRNQATGLRN